MLGRLPSALRGRWEGEYSAPEYPGYPSGRFVWTLGAGLLGGVRGESVDAFGGFPATLRGWFHGGAMLLTKTYECGKTPMCVNDRPATLEEYMRSEPMGVMFDQMTARWADEQLGAGKTVTAEEAARACDRFRESLIADVNAEPHVVDYLGEVAGPDLLRGKWAIAERALPTWGFLWTQAVRGVWEARRVRE